MKVLFLALLLSISMAIQAVFPRVNEMTLEEKLGQLFVVATVADPDNPAAKDVLFARSSKNIPSIKQEYELMELIQQYHIGGVIFLEKARLKSNWQ